MAQMAHQKRTTPNGESSLPIIEPSELAKHNSEKSCWIVVEGLVMDVTHFHHPGGNERLIDLGGLDATRFFHSIGHSNAAHRQLHSLCIGRLATRSSSGSMGGSSSSSSSSIKRTSKSSSKRSSGGKAARSSSNDKPHRRRSSGSTSNKLKSGGTGAKGRTKSKTKASGGSTKKRKQKGK